MSPERATKKLVAAKKLPKALIGPFGMGSRHSCLGIPDIACIYRITCTPIDRHYIGQTTSSARRLLQHLEQLTQRRHPNSALQAAFNAYGASAFSFSIMERLPHRYNEAGYALAEQ